MQTNMHRLTLAGLTKLALNGAEDELGDDPVAALCGLSRLRHLELHTDAATLDLATRAGQLSRLVELTRVDFGDVPTGCMGLLSRTCAALRALPSLKCLAVHDEDSTRADPRYKIAALPKLTDLTICISSFKKAASAAGLRGCPQLTFLRLEGAGVLAILTRAAASLPQLLELQLNEFTAGERAHAGQAGAFAEKLPACQALTSISIEADGMPDCNVAAIRAALDLLPALREATLQGKFIAGALLVLSRSCS